MRGCLSYLRGLGLNIEAYEERRRSDTMKINMVHTLHGSLVRKEEITMAMETQR